MDNSYRYVGSELDTFSKAENWKRRLHRQLAPFIRGRVLEVGAGIGGTTRFLRTDRRLRWTCLEPDPDLARQIVPALAESPHFDLESPTVVVGTVADMPKSSSYEAILYVDVLEHIEHDADELRQASRLLSEGGHLIVVSPAHQWLFSPFDQAIGHYRRYARPDLRNLTPPGLALCQLRYMDSVGLLASAANRFVLKSSTPSQRQLMIWDKLMVPLSGFLDPAIRYCMGKSICAIWRRPMP